MVRERLMSNHSNFFAQDFAARCADLLAHFYRPAKARDRELTLLLAVAAAGLVIPRERLSDSKGQPLLDRPSLKLRWPCGISRPFWLRALAAAITDHDSDPSLRFMW